MAKREEKILSLEEIKAMVSEEGLGWQPGDNEIMKLSPVEQNKLLGLKVTDAEMAQMKMETEMQMSTEMAAFEFAAPFGGPRAWDWSNVSGKNYVSPVRNQGACGSCVSFGTSGAIEANMRIKAGDPATVVDLAEAYMQFCGGGSCNGWGLTSGLEYAKNDGVVDEACMPYQDHDMDCNTSRCANWADRLTRINAYTGHASFQARKDAIANIGPVVAGMAVYSDFFSYASGVYHVASTASMRGYHCVYVIGYNDAEEYWLVQNSWGSNWGDNGRVKIGYGQEKLLIDSQWQFYSVDAAVKPVKGCGVAKHVVVEKRFGDKIILMAYAGDAWRYKIVTDAELVGLAQDVFAADKVSVCWDGNKLTMIRAFKTP